MTKNISKSRLLLKPTLVVVPVPLVRVFSNDKTDFGTFERKERAAETILTDFHIITSEENVWPGKTPAKI